MITNREDYSTFYYSKSRSLEYLCLIFRFYSGYTNTNQLLHSTDKCFLIFRAFPYKCLVVLQGLCSDLLNSLVSVECNV